jgi:hypothetical protein
LKIQKRIISVATVLLAMSWMNPAISAVYGTPVESLGSFNQVGLPLTSTGKIKYYIPLNAADSGTYGVVGPGNTCPLGAGTCSDSGYGSGYWDADALTMNLHFDLSGKPSEATTHLNLWFKDLDLDGVNDPYWFWESVSVSAQNGGASLGTGPIFEGSDIPTSSSDAFSWSLPLAGLGALGDDLWVQLGFGSYAKYHAYNSAEYLKASVVPVPAAIWLFGTALIGFVGMSRRTKVS